MRSCMINRTHNYTQKIELQGENELNDLTTVQMVPTKINAAFIHLGGISEAMIK